MKILLITNIFPPQIGGPATFIDRLAHKLASDEHDVTVLCSSVGMSAELDTSRPFRVVRVDMSNRYRYEITVRTRLAAELARHRKILVNGLEAYVGEIAPRLRRQVLLKIVGDTVWETARNNGLTTDSFDEFQTHRFTDPYLRWLAARRQRQLDAAHTVFTPSHHLRDAVAGWGFPRDRIVVVPNGVDRRMEHAVDRAPGAPLQLGFCGRLVNWKGVETLLLALTRVEGVQLTIVGDGPELPLLTGLRNQLYLQDRVRFTGRLDQHGVAREMGRWHGLVLPSAYEGMSHTLLEAAASGLCCIVSDIGGNREVVTHDGEDGVLVQFGSVPQLAQVLTRLRDDDDWRRRLALGAIATAARFPFEETTRRTIELLEG